MANEEMPMKLEALNINKLESFHNEKAKMLIPASMFWQEAAALVREDETSFHFVAQQINSSL